MPSYPIVLLSTSLVASRQPLSLCPWAFSGSRGLLCLCPGQASSTREVMPCAVSQSWPQPVTDGPAPMQLAGITEEVCFALLPRASPQDYVQWHTVTLLDNVPFTGLLPFPASLPTPLPVLPTSSSTETTCRWDFALVSTSGGNKQRGRGLHQLRQWKVWLQE